MVESRSSSFPLLLINCILSTLKACTHLFTLGSLSCTGVQSERLISGGGYWMWVCGSCCRRKPQILKQTCRKCLMHMHMAYKVPEWKNMAESVWFICLVYREWNNKADNKRPSCQKSLWKQQILGERKSCSEHRNELILFLGLSPTKDSARRFLSNVFRGAKNPLYCLYCFYATYVPFQLHFDTLNMPQSSPNLASRPGVVKNVV